MLSVLGGCNGIFHFRAPVGHQRGRGGGISFRLSHEVTDVGRLVVTAHLPTDGLPVLHVVQQGIVAPRCWEGCGIDNQRLVVGRRADDFFAPVSEDVGLKGRCAFRSIVGMDAFKFGDGAVVECDVDIVQRFTA